MAYKRRTLRRMAPKTRDLGKLVNDLESVTRRLKNYLYEVEQLEMDSRALKHARVATSKLPQEFGTGDLT